MQSVATYLLTTLLLTYFFSAMLTAMFAALAVLTPPGLNAPASRSVVRLGSDGGFAFRNAPHFVNYAFPTKSDAAHEVLLTQS